MYTYDTIKYMLWLAAFMCVLKTKKRKNATTTARTTIDEPDPHGVTPSAKPAALTLSHFGVPQADSNAPKLTRF